MADIKAGNSQVKLFNAATTGNATSLTADRQPYRYHSFHVKFVAAVSNPAPGPLVKIQASLDEGVNWVTVLSADMSSATDAFLTFFGLLPLIRAVRVDDLGGGTTAGAVTVLGASALPTQNQ